MNNVSIIVFLSFVLFNVINNEACLKQLPATEATPAAIAIQYRGVWISDCAPWDGAAVTISVSDKEISCSTEQYPYFEIKIYKPESEISGKSFSFPNEVEIGSINKVTMVNRQKKFIGIKSGTIKFEEATKTSNFSGTFDVEFEDGKKASGLFVAKKCEHIALCG